MMSSAMRKVRSWWLAVAVASALYVVVLACNSPFIPIPPPDPTFAPGSSPGQWNIVGPPDSRAIGALYYIYNANQRLGLIVAASDVDGSYAATGLIGQAGDHVNIYWEKTSVDRSSTICRILGQGLAQLDCR